MSDGDSESEYRLPPSELREFAAQALEHAGVAEKHASTVAEALVRADLRGVDSHGIARLEPYIKKFEAGGFNTDPDISIEYLSDRAAMVDADDGPGQSAGVRGIDAAMGIADDLGVGIATVTNSNHFGTAAYYTERASSKGYIGLAMTNVGSDVAPFGGVDPFLGTNPISFSIPTDREFPITLDMATSTVAMGKIDHATEEDEEIPEDWALDGSGEPTTDPNEVAALRPVGGPKGYGLAIVVDVLCGVLTGVGTSPTIGPLYDDYHEPMRLGHFFGAIDPSAFVPLQQFEAAIGDYINRLRGQEPAEGVDQIRLPGEIEFRTRERRSREGIPLNADAVEGIRSLSAAYGIDSPLG